MSDGHAASLTNGQPYGGSWAQRTKVDGPRGDLRPRVSCRTRGPILALDPDVQIALPAELLDDEHLARDRAITPLTSTIWLVTAMARAPHFRHVIARDNESIL